MLTASTLIFMKRSPEDSLLRLDYLIAVVCTVLYAIDLYSLIYTTVVYTKVINKKMEEKNGENILNSEQREKFNQMKEDFVQQNIFTDTKQPNV